MPSGDMSIRGEKMTASLTGLPVGLWTRRTASVTPLPFFTSAFTGSKVDSLAPANAELGTLMTAAKRHPVSPDLRYIAQGPHVPRLGVALTCVGRHPTEY